MRVLFLQEEFCIRALKQAASLASHGIEVYGLSFRAPGSFYGLDTSKWFKQFAIANINRPEVISKACEKWNIDIIHSHNWPDSYTCLAVKANCAPVIHDTHDMQSLIMQDAGRTLNKHEAEFEKNANLTSHGRIYVTEQMAVLAEKKYGVNTRSLIVPCLTSLKFKPLKTLSKLGLTDGNTHIVYQGGFLGPKDKKHSYYLYDVIKDFIDSGVHIHVYMSNPDPTVIKFYNQLGNNLHLRGKISPSQLAIELTQYDYGLALFNKNLIDSDCLSTGFANKFGDYLLSGVPPIVDLRTPSMHRFVEENKCGIAADNIEDAIAKIKDSNYTSQLNLSPEVINLITYECYFSQIKQLYIDTIASWKK